MTRPLVSVVTPFFNTAAYLRECIESVLAQTYDQFEYILVDNCSTDGSGEIAQAYAARDPRVRFFRRPQLLPQVPNYNRALSEISNESKYCKIVQADDFIFPECLRLMVEAFEQSDSIGLVSAYDLKGDVVRGSGFPYGTSPIPGPDVVRLYFRTGIFPFGSPTTVMYRSSIVRGGYPFFAESLLHEDTEKCLEILEKWDFAFVHQVLSWLRIDEKSISGTARTFVPEVLDRYVNVRRYAGLFLEPADASELKQDVKREYYRVLAARAVAFPGGGFWEYHRTGLKTLGENLDRSFLLRQIARCLILMIINPGTTLAVAWRASRRLCRRGFQRARRVVFDAESSASSSLTR